MHYLRKFFLAFIEVADLSVASNQQTLHGLDILIAERVTGPDVFRQRPLHVDGRMMGRDFFRGTLARVVINRDRSPREMLLVFWKLDPFETVPRTLGSFKDHTAVGEGHNSFHRILFRRQPGIYM